MSDRYVLVQDEYDLERFRSLDGAEGEYSVLATRPAPAYELRRSGTRVATTAEHISHEEFDDIAAGNLEPVYEYCASLDSLLHESFPSLPTSFEFFDSLAMQLRWTVNSLHYRHRELTNFFDAVAPSELHYWPREQLPFNLDNRGQPVQRQRHPFTWAVAESVTTTLLETPALQDASDCSFVSRKGGDESVFDPVPSSGATGVKARGKALAKRLLNENRLDGIRKVDYETIDPMRILGASPTEPFVLVTEQNPYVWTFLRDERNDDVDVDAWLHWEVKPASLTSGRVVDLPATDPSDRLPDLTSAAVDSMLELGLADSTLADRLPDPVRTATLDRLIRFVTKRLPVDLALHERALAYFDARDVDCILCGPNDRHRSQLISQAGAVHGVPTVSFQHGGAYGYLNNSPILYDEVRNDVFCAFGQKGAENVEAFAEDVGRSIKAVSIGVDHVRAGYETNPLGAVDQTGSVQPRERPTLLYASSGLVGTRRQGPRFWYDDLDYVEHQFELADVLAHIDDYDVVFKLHYKSRVDNPLPRYIAESGYDIDLVSDRPFTEVLPRADVVLTDRPTTTLLEAMLFGKYVVFLDIGWFEWFDGARETLADCIPIVDRGTGWDDRLRMELEAARTGDRMLNYQPFLEAYCDPRYRPGRLWETIGLQWDG